MGNMDGSVRFVSDGVDALPWHAMSSINGSEGLRLESVRKVALRIAADCPGITDVRQDNSRK